LRGEQEYPVGPLAVPASATDQPGAAAPTATDYPAVQLFILRAREARPDFTLDAVSTAATVEVCRRLDGLPLAIELAAARVRVLPPPLLLARLMQASPGSPRLAILGGGPRDAPARQQTLEAAIAWSYDLLDPAEQAIFRQLAVFVGGFTLAAAEAVVSVAGDEVHLAGAAAGSMSMRQSVFDPLSSLIDHSLVIGQVRSRHDDAAPRFRMLETIREFALERLVASGDAERVREIHTAYYLALA
jgi:predicted ATPase